MAAQYPSVSFIIHINIKHLLYSRHGAKHCLDTHHPHTFMVPAFMCLTVWWRGQTLNYHKNENKISPKQEETGCYESI